MRIQTLRKSGKFNSVSAQRLRNAIARLRDELIVLRKKMTGIAQCRKAGLRNLADDCSESFF